MPIEIRELIIKATVDEGESNKSGSVGENKSTENQTNDLIAICVDKVLEVLKDKNER